MAGQVAISVHGPRAGTIEAYAGALETGAEYVEFDIRRTADGELAAFHDARTRQGEALAAVGYTRLCELAGGEPPPGAGGGAEAMPPGRTQDDDMDGRRRCGDQALAG